MLKAKQNTTTTVDGKAPDETRRRLVLNTAAAVLAGAAVAIGKTAKGAAVADAKLLALGVELENAWREMNALNERTAPAWEQVRDEVDAIRDRYNATPDEQKTAKGFPAQWPADVMDWPGEFHIHYVELHSAAWKEAEKEFITPELVAIGEEASALGEECNELVEEIMAAPATSLAGLAVKGRAIMFLQSDWWLDGGEPVELKDLDWDERLCRQLVEAIGTLAGAPMAPQRG